MNKSIIKFLTVVLLGTIVFSCAPTKKGAYIRKSQDVAGINKPDKIFFIDNDTAELIEEGDQLYITVSSGNSEPNSFNQVVGSGLNFPELLAYMVDKEGYISVPYLKKIKVADLSINQLVDQLETELSQYIYLPTVSIRIINSRFAVLGEVGSPGMYVYNRNTLNVFQAIAQAGDISPFGNRRKVMIIRQKGEVVTKKHFDLLNDEIITSDWYFIQPDDIIYVEPLARKKWGMETFSVFAWLSLITTLVLTYTLLTGNTLTNSN